MSLRGTLSALGSAADSSLRHVLSKRFMWVLAIMLVDTLFFFIYPSWFHGPLVAKMESVLVQVGTDLQSELQRISLLDFVTQSGTLEAIGVLLLIVALLIISVYVCYTIYAAVTWWFAEFTMGHRHRLLLKRFFMIHLYWVGVVVVIRIVYLIARLPASISGWTVVEGVLAFLAFWLTVLVAILAFWSYPRLIDHSARDAFRWGIAEVVRVRFWVIAVAIIIGALLLDRLLALFAFTGLPTWIGLVIVLLTLVYLRVLTLRFHYEVVV